MTKRWKAIIVGFGKIAGSHASDPLSEKWFPASNHVQFLRNSGHFDLCGIVDRSETAREAAQDFWKMADVAATPSGIAHLEPEVAVITTPPESRIEILEALPSLKGVMVEKPIGLDDNIADEFAAYCNSRGLIVQTHFWRRGHPELRELSKRKLHDKIGNLQAGLGLYGGGLFNNGGHLVDLIRLLLGRIVSVQAVSDIVSDKSFRLANDLELSFVLNLEGGGKISVSPIDFDHYREIGIDLWGTAGRFSLLQESLVASEFPLSPNRALSDTFEISSDNGRHCLTAVASASENLYRNLSAALSNHETLWSSIDSALLTEKILQEAIRSARYSGVLIPIVEPELCI